MLTVLVIVYLIAGITIAVGESVHTKEMYGDEIDWLAVAIVSLVWPVELGYLLYFLIKGE